MPAGLVLHKAHAFALDGVGQNHDRLAAGGAGLRECRNELLHVVPVRVHNLPSKTCVFVGERLYLHHVFDPSIDLQAIAVDDGDDVVEVVVAGLHSGFPDLALLLFAVAHEAEYFVLPAVDARGQSHADGDAEALAKRAGRNFNTGQPEPVGMPLKWRMEFAQCDCIVERTKAREAERYVKRGRLVAGGPEDAVAIRP
jgi:hypothetical protein